VLLDTTAALKRLGLNIRRAKVASADGSNKFYITAAGTSEEVSEDKRKRQRSAGTSQDVSEDRGQLTLTQT